jgi:hypothetical protein
VSHGIPRTLAILGLIAILGSLVLHLLTGTACLRARSTSDCHRCCQRETASDPQAPPPGSPCSLFCCTGMPAHVEISAPPVLNLAVAVPAVQGFSAHRAPSPPPPRFSLLIHSRPGTG